MRKVSAQGAAGVKVEACALTEVIGRVVRNMFAARACVWADDDQPELGGDAAVLALFSDVGVGAGEARQIDDDGAGALNRLRRREH
jgi:hypothetical protein